MRAAPLPSGVGLFARLAPVGAETGSSLIEILVVLVVLGVLASFAGPATASAVDSSRARQAAGFAAAQLRYAKQQAVTSTAATALVFDQIAGRWTFRVCVDGNGNGLRRADVRSGIDTCPSGPFDVATMFPGVEVAVDATIRGPYGDPPSIDPVKFGSSDLASFSPSGGCTAGSLFLRSARGSQYVVRVAGVTGRMRILKYDEAAAIWREL